MDKMWSQSCDSNYTNNLITYISSGIEVSTLRGAPFLRVLKSFWNPLVKFIYSEKAAKFYEIFTLLLTGTT